MAIISVNSHNFLGKLTIIKNHLSLVLQRKKVRDDQKLTESLGKAFKANQELIDLIKMESQNG